jgi:serine protease Do
MRIWFAVCAGLLVSALAAVTCLGGAISSFQSEMTALFEKVKPSVVTVVCTVGGREFVSTGIIMDREGHVLTTKDFSGKPESAEIQFDSQKISAKLLGYDRDSKLAVLKVDGAQLVPARAGDSDGVKPATWVMIVGNSLGISPSVAVGLISGRRIEDDMLQVGASISPGNSGAGVFNSEGELIGIVSAALTRPFYLTVGGDKKLSADFALSSRGELPLGGSGLLIPANRARQAMKDIIEHGTAEHGWLGVTLQSLDDLMKSALNVKQGALVASVLSDSPAEKGGLAEGDVITEYGGRAVDGVDGLARMVKETKPGEKVSVVVLRKTKKKTLSVKVGERPEEESMLRQFRIEMPDVGAFSRAAEAFMTTEKKAMDSEIKELKAEILRLKQELKKTRQEGGL